MGASHAYLRALDRYGIRLRISDFDHMKDQIRDGTAIKIRRVSTNISVYICGVRETAIVVVYNRKVKFFITVLPWEEALKAGYDYM